MLLGVIEFQEAKRIRSRLEEIGVPVELRSNPETCSPGGNCAPSVEVHVDDADLDKVREFFQAERQRDQGDAEANPELHSEVFDLGKDEAVCPACGTQFKTTARECPDCGLMFAVPEEEAGDGS